MSRRVPSLARSLHHAAPALLMIGGLNCMPNDPSKSAFNAQRMEVRRNLDKIDLSDCSTKDGPSGIGRITLIFGGNGKVRNAVQEWAPFVQDPVGECVAKKLATVTAKPYEGAGQKLVYLFSVPEFGTKRETALPNAPAHPDAGVSRTERNGHEETTASRQESKECEAAKLLCTGGTTAKTLEACTAAKNACLASMGL